MRAPMKISRSLLILGLGAFVAACQDGSTPLSPVKSVTPLMAKSGPNALPTNGRIYFVSDFAGSYDVYSMKSDGTDRRRLTLSSEQESSLGVSRDGKKLVVAGSNGSVSELVTLNVDGTNRRVIYSDATAGFMMPAFSPDGRTIAFVSNLGSAPGTYSIWTIPASGGKATRLTPSTEMSTHPSWSPDGSKIIYVISPAGTMGGDLWTMNADGSAPTLYYDCAEACLNPVWSASGGQIPYIAVKNGALTIESCYPFYSFGQCGHPIPYSGYPAALALSPDGSQLAYLSFDVNNLTVETIVTSNANGTAQSTVTPNLLSISSLAWGR